MYTPIKKLQEYFANGKRPNGSQFAELIKSLWHKSEQIPFGQVKGLADAVNSIQFEGAKTYQSLTELRAVSPVPADGTAAKVANDGANNGYYSVVNGVWVKDADLVAQEVDKSNTSIGVSGYAVTEWADNEIFRAFLGDKSLFGIPGVHKNHIFSYISATEGEYKYSSDFDCVWVLLSEKSINLTVTGAVFARLLFFSSATPSADTLLQSTKNYKNVKVPQGSVLALLTLRKTENPEGYDNLKVEHLGVAVSQGELINSERSSLLRLDYKIERNSLLAINNGLVEYVVNDDFDSILVSVYRDSRYITVTGVVMHRISYFSSHEDLSLSSFLSSSEEYVSKVPQGSVLALLTLRKTDNSGGYDNLKVEQIGAPPSSLQLLQNTGNLFSISGRFINRDGNEIIYEQVDTTPFLPITGKDNIEVKGANTASVPAIVFFDKNYKCIGSLSEMSKTANRTYKVAVSDIPEQTAYIRCNRNNVADRDDSYIRGFNVASMLKMVSDLSSEVQNPPTYTRVVSGKNLLNPNEFLLGVTYASSSGLVASVDGILSNKLRLTAGYYTVQGITAYRANKNIARILKFNDRDELLGGDGIILNENGVGQYRVKSTLSGEGANGYVSHWRLVLQYDKNRLFNEKTAQFEKGEEATDFEECKTELVENPYYNKPEMTAFLTGASSSIPGNGYFETACEKLGLKHRNVAVSGESVMQHADKAWRGTLYTPEELEEIDVFVTSHIHNYNVAFEGKRFEKTESFNGALNLDGSYITFENSDSWEVDVYNVSRKDKELLVSTVGINSSLPYVVFKDKDKNFISSIMFNELTTNTPTPIIDKEISIPKNTSYMYVKRFTCNGNAKTELRGKTLGVLCATLQEYESKGYDNQNNPLTVPLDKNNTNHRLLPFGGQGSQGALIPNDLYDERYSAGYDYLIKKYKKDCYDLRLNPNSKWYGSKSGKPPVIICVNQWHDAYIRYNESLKVLAKRHGAIYCDVAGKLPFSYRENNPLDTNAIRNTAMYCNNAAYGSGNDTEDIPINGVVYTNMGWHPTRKWDEPIQLMRANALVQSLREAIWRLGKFHK